MEQSPELKSLIGDIVNKFLNYINAAALKDFVYNLVEKRYNKGLEEGEINFNRNFLPNYETVSFIQNYAFENVKGMTEELKEKLRKEMSIGLMNHESIPQLKIRIMDVMNATIERAEMITRTEAVRAMNMGHFQAAKDSGIELQKQWSTHEDERTCKTCGFLDGQVVDMNGKFKDQDGEEFLLSPAHPNCRCRVLYVQPQRPKVKAEAEFMGHSGKWRTVMGKHIFISDDGSVLGGDGKKFEKHPAHEGLNCKWGNCEVNSLKIKERMGTGRVVSPYSETENLSNGGHYIYLTDNEKHVHDTVIHDDANLYKKVKPYEKMTGVFDKQGYFSALNISSAEEKIEPPKDSNMMFGFGKKK